MNRDQETHPIRVNARYEMYWANSFFKKFQKPCLQTDGKTDGPTDRRTDRHRGESSLPPFHLQWSWGIIISIYPDSKDPQIDIDWTHPETLVSGTCYVLVETRQLFAIHQSDCCICTAPSGTWGCGFAGQLAKLTLTTHQLLLHGIISGDGQNMKICC